MATAQERVAQSITIRPLAGTRRRGKDEAEDVALAEELLAAARFGDGGSLPPTLHDILVARFLKLGAHHFGARSERAVACTLGVADREPGDGRAAPAVGNSTMKVAPWPSPALSA